MVTICRATAPVATTNLRQAMRPPYDFEIVRPDRFGEATLAGRRLGNMNLKAAHLVSVQFGIFVGVVFCLVVFHFENSRPRTVAEKRAPMSERAAEADSLSQSEDQPGDIADNDADADLAELAVEQPRTPLPNEYSPEAVERYRAEATRLYYEQIAPRRHTTVAAVAPAYTEAVEEPAVDQTYDPAPEPVAYVQPTQVIVYPQPVQFVVFSQRGRHANRCRSDSAPGALASDPNRHRDGRGTHSNASRPFERPASPSSTFRRSAGSSGIAQHRNTGGSSCSPTQGFTERGVRSYR